MISKTAIALWIVVQSAYPPPGNNIFIGKYPSCKNAQEIVDKWMETHHRPEGYGGWVCIKWHEHLRIMKMVKLLDGVKDD
jgi:hypothetical protein